ncbi:hypothetical protein [Microbacterium sp.]|uniref:hypothetical protein n=1 Tax=Microbacterium sp. TaxID=51671 RepID=UPI00334007C4
MDLLRIAGVPGAGKSAVAWEIARRLTDAGEAVAYVDIDQLGMCYPAPADDPQRWLLKERALALVSARFAAAGCAALVVSGVADPGDRPPASAYATTSLWLDVTEQTQRARLSPRGWPQEQIDAVVVESAREAGGVHPAWQRRATDHESLAQTVEAVLAEWRRETSDAGGSEADAPRPVPGRVLWLTGPRGVGTSRIAWEIVSGHWFAGRCAGFVDARQLSFAFAAGDRERLGAENAADLHGLFAGIGAGVFIVAAPLEIPPDDVAKAFPDAEVTFIRLYADADALRRRIGERRRGGGPVLAGDDLAEATDAGAAAVLAEALRERDVPLRPGEGCFDTTDLAPAESAAALGL